MIGDQAFDLLDLQVGRSRVGANAADRTAGTQEPGRVPHDRVAACYALVDVLDRVLDKGLVVAGDIKVSLAEVERCVILETLRRTSGNKTKTAAVLGISLKTLHNKLNKFRGRGGKPEEVSSA